MHCNPNPVEIRKSIVKKVNALLERDTHIGVGIIQKMEQYDGQFDGEEKAFFCWLQSFYFSLQKEYAEEE